MIGGYLVAYLRIRTKCECCASGCDCGCAEECPLREHRASAALPTRPTPEGDPR